MNYSSGGTGRSRTQAEGSASNRNQNKKKRKKNYKQRAKPFSIFLSTILIILVMAGFAVCGAVIGGYVAIIQSIPEIDETAYMPSTYTTNVVDSQGNLLFKLHGNENREYTSLDTIPQNLKDAVVAIEDERFYDHDGVDFKGLVRAVYSTLTHKQVQGGSTITQQVIKNNVAKITHNDVRSKLKEQYLALKYEKQLKEQLGSKKAAKDRILELYLNTIGLGHGYNGVKVAARGYFGKDVKDLDLAECAVIAGITNNPTMYSPRLQPESNKKRQTIILQYMLEQGYITKEEYDAAVNEDVYTSIEAIDLSYEENDEGEIHNYFEDALIEQVSSDLQKRYGLTAQEAAMTLYNGGLTITSTVDPKIQKIVDEAYMNDSLFPKVEYCIDITYVISIKDETTGETEHKEYKSFALSQESAENWVAQTKASVTAQLTENQTVLADRATYNVQPQSAIVIEDYRTGEIKAISGGRGKKTVNLAFNRATDATRQAGSVFKIISTYAPALNTGKITPATTLVDEPYTADDGYAPNNWYMGYRGKVTLRTAIKDSMNVVAVKTFVDTGINTCLDYLEKFGISTLVVPGSVSYTPEHNDVNASTPLGGLTVGVKQTEVAGAFGAIANGGLYLRPMFYSSVIDREGNTILSREEVAKSAEISDSTQVISEAVAFELTDLMQSVVKDGTGTAAALTSGMPVAGKTGTTTDSRDLTFAGYTPYYVCSIWLGYDRYYNSITNMESLDQTAHLKVWKYIMDKVHEGLEVKEFTPPLNVSSVDLCSITGQKANGYCPVIKTYFAAGTEPKDYCTGHGGYYNGGYSSTAAPTQNYDNDYNSQNYSDEQGDGSGEDSAENSGGTDAAADGTGGDYSADYSGTGDGTDYSGDYSGDYNTDYSGDTYNDVPYVDSGAADYSGDAGASEGFE